MLKTFERSLIYQNESKLDRCRPSSVTRHSYVHCPIVAAVREEDCGSAHTPIAADIELPTIGPRRTRSKRCEIREVLEGSYRIIYHLLDDEVDIIAVVHSARPWPENP